MKFYKVEIKYEENAFEVLEKNHAEIELRTKFGPNSPIDLAAACIKKWGEIFLYDYSSKSMSCGLVMKDEDKLDDAVEKFVKKLEIQYKTIAIEEITIGDLSEALECAEDLGFIRYYSLTRELGIGRILDDWREDRCYEEYMISTITKKKAIEEAEQLPFGAVLCSELERIYYDSQKAKWYGYPVRYIIESSARKPAYDSMKLLSAALFTNNRVKNAKYGVLSVDGRDFLNSSFLDAVYRLNQGSALYINLKGIIADDEGDIVRGGTNLLGLVCEHAKKYHDDVLTVFVIAGNRNTNLVEKILGLMDRGAYITIREEEMKYVEALRYLKRKASTKKVRVDKRMLGYLNEEKGYYTKELNEIFDEWFDNKLRRSIYPQYSDMTNLKLALAEKESRGSAYEELNKMIGLKSAKRVVNDAINMSKAQKIYASKGMNRSDVSRHMVFTGNPGTAKTTVARLFARILKENEIIKSSEIVEVGRGDLVGKYVGWTAPTIIRKFKEAKGGILFIDEAYSLVDDRDGSYGDEAINTIVQEMENHRDDVIVIFAGYPDKMESFLDKNPGLRSRIAFHVRFEDYSVDELCDIAKLMAEGKGLKISDSAMEKTREVMGKAIHQRDFGNGRFVRNLIERAQMAQASRLVEADYDDISAEDVSTICAEDIVISDYIPKEKHTIGFAV